jgi:hypothetical protein
MDQQSLQFTVHFLNVDSHWLGLGEHLLQQNAINNAKKKTNALEGVMPQHMLKKYRG